jgi:hypothetical protein
MDFEKEVLRKVFGHRNVRIKRTVENTAWGRFILYTP